MCGTPVSHSTQRVKEEEKKYSPLAHQVRKLYSVSTRVVPIVVGSLGVVTRRLEHSLKELGIPDVLGSLQTLEPPTF